jgi:hypothetical protein
MQFYKNNHMYLKGTITLNLTEALKDRNSPGLTEKVLNLQHGQPFALSLHRDMDVIFGYCESISHTFTIGDGGIEAGLTTIEYSRGHVGVAAEALRDDVEVPIRPAAQQKSSTPTTSSTSTASSKNNCTVVSTYGPAKSNKALRLDAGVRIYATMRAAGFSPALSFALAHQASFESGWDPDAVRWCRKDEFATDIGLFQINYAGMGKAREGFQDKKPADTRYSSRYDSTKHWDASDPNLNCQRVIYGLKKLGFEANKKYKSLEEAYHAVWFDSYLTSGQAKSGLYDFRNNKGKTLYVEPRRYLVGASWADGKATYNMTGAVSTPFPRGVIVTGCNPSAYNVTGVGTLSSDKKSVTVSMTTNPGVWILGGLLSTKPWEDSTFTDRYESLDGIFNPNNNYFTDTRTNDKLGVADGIIKLLAQRFGL